MLNQQRYNQRKTPDALLRIGVIALANEYIDELMHRICRTELLFPMHNA